MSTYVQKKAKKAAKLKAKKVRYQARKRQKDKMHHMAVKLLEEQRKTRMLHEYYADVKRRNQPKRAETKLSTLWDAFPFIDKAYASEELSQILSTSRKLWTVEQPNKEI